jgi:hypothetical protein
MRWTFPKGASQGNQALQARSPNTSIAVATRNAQKFRKNSVAGFACEETQHPFSARWVASVNFYRQECIPYPRWHGEVAAIANHSVLSIFRPKGRLPNRTNLLKEARIGSADLGWRLTRSLF